MRLVFVRAASLRDLPPEEMMAVHAGDKEILLANQAGRIYALGNVCTHAGCPLSDGRMYPNSVQCICHGSRFDLRNGRVVEGPAEEPVPVYGVKVQGDDILVDV